MNGIVVVVILMIINFTVSERKISERQYVSMLPLFHLDDYDKCMLYGEKFLYCIIIFQLAPINKENPSNVWNITAEVIADPSNYRHDLLRYGICVPKIFPYGNKLSYKNENKLISTLNEYYNQKYRYLGLKGNLTKMMCEKKQSFEFNDYSFYFIITFVLYIMILLCATLYETFYIDSNNNNNSTFKKILLALSFRKNWQRFTCVDFQTKDMNTLKCLQGFRVFNTVSVIIAHTVLMNAKLPPINPYFIETEARVNHVKLDSTHSMQVFFMISSFLLCYQLLKVHEKGEKLSLSYFFKMFIKRYIRLTPILALNILFVGFWMIHLNNGPLWNSLSQKICENCRINWWSNLLYINNFLIFGEMCFGHTWYLAVNTQFYILSFFIVWIILKYKKWVYYIFGILLIFHIVYLFSMYYNKNYTFQLQMAPEHTYTINKKKLMEFNDNHTSAYVNSGGFITGLIFGYLFYINKNRKLITRKIQVVIWWIFILIVPTVINVIDSYTINNRFYNALYGSLRRIIFVSSQCILFWGMSEGQGWILKWFSESSFVYMLGRLTYSVYIIHPIIQQLLIGRQRTLHFFSVSTILNGVITDTTLSFLGALIMVLLIEMPMTELITIFMSRQHTKISKND